MLETVMSRRGDNTTLELVITAQKSCINDMAFAAEEELEEVLQRMLQ